MIHDIMTIYVINIEIINIQNIIFSVRIPIIHFKVHCNAFLTE